VIIIHFAYPALIYPNYIILKISVLLLLSNKKHVVVQYVFFDNSINAVNMV